MIFAGAPPQQPAKVAANTTARLAGKGVKRRYAKQRPPRMDLGQPDVGSQWDQHLNTRDHFGWPGYKHNHPFIHQYADANHDYTAVADWLRWVASGARPAVSPASNYQGLDFAQFPPTAVVMARAALHGDTFAMRALHDFVEQHGLPGPVVGRNALGQQIGPQTTLLDLADSFDAAVAQHKQRRENEIMELGPQPDESSYYSSTGASISGDRFEKRIYGYHNVPYYGEPGPLTDTPAEHDPVAPGLPPPRSRYSRGKRSIRSVTGRQRARRQYAAIPQPAPPPTPPTPPHPYFHTGMSRPEGVHPTWHSLPTDRDWLFAIVDPESGYPPQARGLAIAALHGDLDALFYLHDMVQELHPSATDVVDWTSTPAIFQANRQYQLAGMAGGPHTPTQQWEQTYGPPRISPEREQQAQQALTQYRVKPRNPSYYDAVRNFDIRLPGYPSVAHE